MSRPVLLARAALSQRDERSRGRVAACGFAARGFATGRFAAVCFAACQFAAVCSFMVARARRGARGDSGSIAPFVAFLGITMFLLAGLVIDSSRQLTARARAVAIAEEAARAGAEAANPADRDLTLDPQLVGARVDAYCTQARASEAHLTDCRLDGINGPEVTVSTRISLPAGPLGMIKSTLNASGTGSAHSEVGTTQDDAQ